MVIVHNNGINILINTIKSYVHPYRILKMVKLKVYFQKAAVTPAINTIPKTGGIPDSKNC
jgi:hypothetical protein